MTFRRPFHPRSPSDHSDTEMGVTQRRGDFPVSPRHPISVSHSNRVFFSVRVSTVRSDDVEDPAEQAGSPTPEEKSKEQPHESSQDAAVVNLAEARNNQTQDSSYKRIAHRLKLPPQWKLIRRQLSFCSSLSLAVAPHVNYLAPERLQHLLHDGTVLRQFAQTLLFESFFIIATERFTLGLRILDDDSYADLFAGDFATGLAHELHVLRLRKRVAKVPCVRRKLDTQFALFKRCRLRRFERSHQQHLSLCFQDAFDSLNRRDLCRGHWGLESFFYWPLECGRDCRRSKGRSGWSRARARSFRIDLPRGA